MYSSIIDRTISHVYQKGVANKILQSMDRIRNEYDRSQARRWPTELLQNARDLKYDDQSVRVQFELTDDCVYFRHSGKPFSVRDILSILNQVSSKKPGEGVGQFGTGFMSTFQLSMQVTVHSFLKDGDEPYKEFEICLDRSGTTYQEISDAIFEALNSLRQVDHSENVDDFEPNMLNTEFCYHLTQPQNKEIARIGMEDMKRTLIYTMLFSEGIGQVELLFRTSDCRQDLCFRRGGTIAIADSIVQQKILVGDEVHSCLLCRENNIALAVEWDKNRGYLPLDADAPRLYIDFPLVGSESFPFPVVINSRAFHPNEPRSGISLVEYEQSQDAATNRALIDEAVAVYQRFFRELVAIRSQGCENLITIIPQVDHREWSATWVRSHIYDALYQFLSHQSILPIGDERKALSDANVFLVNHDDAAVRGKLSDLCCRLRGVEIPERGVDWYAAFAGYEVPEDKYLTLRQILEQASSLLERGFRAETESVTWLSDLYDLAMTDETMATEVLAGNHAIFPSQNVEEISSCKLHTVKELQRDPGIPEILKDVADCLDGLEENGSLRIRKKLLHKHFCPNAPFPLNDYPVLLLAEHITERSNRRYRVRNYSFYREKYDAIWITSWKMLLACGGDQEMHELASAIWSDLGEYRSCVGDLFAERMWISAYRSILDAFLEFVRYRKTIQSLSERITDVDAVLWLDRLYKKVSRYCNSTDYHFSHVIPNQYGDFCMPAELKMDQINDERLKQIAVSLKAENERCNVKRLLVEQRLKLSGWTIPTMTLDEVTGYINSALQQVLTRTSLSNASEEIQDACTQLLSWIRSNPQKAEQNFPAFCREEDQMKLLTPRAAVGLQQKADQLNEILTMLGTEDLSQISLLMQKAQSWDESVGGYDPETGIFMDAEWSVMDALAREERLRRIGLGGEKSVLRMIGDHFITLGYLAEQEDEHNTRFVNADGSKRVTVYYPDTELYHQPGWDISVKIETGECVEEYFLEVKTHTPRSMVRSVLSLSNQQMKKAAKEKDRYILVYVIYDEKTGNAVEVHELRDVIAQLAHGALTNGEGRYVLRYCAQ